MKFLGHAVPDNPNELPAFWQARTTDLLPYNAGATAVAEAFALHLERALQAYANETLNLRQSAEESNFHEDHLGKLVREGKIPNAGRPYAPRIRRADLPKKASRNRSLVVAAAKPARKFQAIRRLVVSNKGVK